MGFSGIYSSLDLCKVSCAAGCQSRTFSPHAYQFAKCSFFGVSGQKAQFYLHLSTALVSKMTLAYSDVATSHIDFYVAVTVTISWPLFNVDLVCASMLHSRMLKWPSCVIWTFLWVLCSHMGTLLCLSAQQTCSLSQTISWPSRSWSWSWLSQFPLTDIS